MDYPSDPDLDLFNGKFTDGDPLVPIPASRDSSSWANGVTDEMLKVITESGLVPDEMDNTQMFEAIKELIAKRAPAVVASARGLVVKNNAATPASKVDITADELVLRDATGRAQLVTAVNLTADIAAAGVDGLDTGAEAASTWYYLWVAYNAGTSTAASLISASSAAPTLPAGYSFTALLGAIYNDAGSNFDTTHQIDRVAYMPGTNAFTAKNTVAANTYESFSLATIIPPIAKSVFGTFGGLVGSGFLAIATAGDANGLGVAHAIGQGVTGTFDGFEAAARYEVPLPTAQTIYWKTSSTSISSRLNVSGYRI